VVIAPVRRALIGELGVDFKVVAHRDPDVDVPVVAVRSVVDGHPFERDRVHLVLGLEPEGVLDAVVCEDGIVGGTGHVDETLGVAAVRQLVAVIVDAVVADFTAPFIPTRVDHVLTPAVPALTDGVGVTGVGQFARLSLEGLAIEHAATLRVAHVERARVAVVADEFFARHARGEVAVVAHGAAVVVRALDVVVSSRDGVPALVPLTPVLRGARVAVVALCVAVAATLDAFDDTGTAHAGVLGAVEVVLAVEVRSALAERNPPALGVVAVDRAVLVIILAVHAVLLRHRDFRFRAAPDVFRHLPLRGVGVAVRVVLAVDIAGGDGEEDEEQQGELHETLHDPPLGFEDTTPGSYLGFGTFQFQARIFFMLKTRRFPCKERTGEYIIIWLICQSLNFYM